MCVFVCKCKRNSKKIDQITDFPESLVSTTITHFYSSNVNRLETTYVLASPSPPELGKSIQIYWVYFICNDHKCNTLRVLHSYRIAYRSRRPDIHWNSLIPFWIINGKMSINLFDSTLKCLCWWETKMVTDRFSFNGTCRSIVIIERN